MSCMLGYFGIQVLEFMKVVGDIIWHGEDNSSWIIIVTVYFDATVNSAGLINTHRVIFSDKLYEMIFMLIPIYFTPNSSTTNRNVTSCHLCFQRTTMCPYCWYPCGDRLFVR